MAEGGRIETAFTTPRTYVSQCCGVHASYPAHKRELSCEAQHAARIWRSPTLTAARSFLAELDAAVVAAVRDGNPALTDEQRPLSRHLRAVLAEVEREATGVRR